MKCPYCDEEMQQGYIQSRDGVYWTEKKRPIPALLLGGGKTVRLSQFIGTNKSVIAFYCARCEKVIMNINTDA